MNDLIQSAIKKYIGNNPLKILIIGPGRSDIAEYIIVRNQCVAIDMVDHNQSALDFQERLIAKHKVEKRFISSELSVDNLGLINSNYNLILCTEVLEHVQNNAPLIAKLHMLLEKEGILIVSVPNGRIDQALMKINNKYMCDTAMDRGHVNFYNKAALYRIFSLYDFNILLFRKIASEYSLFHLMLVLFRIHVDADTGQIYDSKHFIVIWGGRLMRLMGMFRLNVILNMVIPRCYFLILTPMLGTGTTKHENPPLTPLW